MPSGPPDTAGMTIAAIFGVLGRFVGRVLTMALGWASTLLFGRVPRDRQVYLAAITFGAVIWAVLLVGILVPDIGAWLLAFTPIPPSVDENWVRLGMITAAVLLPALLGAATLKLVKPDDRPGNVRDFVVQIARGYPLAAGLALMLVFLGAIGIVRKVGSIVRRRTDAHVPIVLKPGGYEGLVDDLDDALTRSDLEVAERDAPRVLVVPGRILATVAGPSVRALLPDRLVQLVGTDLEVLIYPSDISISGSKARVARAQAAIASRLTTSDAWMTATEEAQQVEDALARLAEKGGNPTERTAILRDVDRRLASQSIPYEEWEVLFRERLQVERDLLVGREPAATGPATAGDEMAADSRPHSRRELVRDPLGLVAALVGVGLMIVNAVLVLLERRDAEKREADGARRRFWSRGA